MEEKRLKTWDTLSQEEQRLISTPFPVIYGVKPKNSKTVISNSSAPNLPEIGLKNGSSFDEIKVIFVPKNQIKFTQKLLGSNKEIQVKSLDQATINHTPHLDVVERAKAIAYPKPTSLELQGK